MESAETQFGRYRLLRRLGQGGMAEVYLAESTGPGGFRKRVAIKRLLPHYAANRRFVSMLRDEAHIAAAIRHPHVAEVLDFGSVEGTHYIAMEYIDGVDLAGVLRTLKSNGRSLPLTASLYIAKAVAEGLSAAHALKDQDGNSLEVIHRDVSPHNILASYEGAVKLIDFGVAKAANNSTRTKSGVIKGKLQYMSPEQAQAQAVDGRSDVFSLGMTLYKMITGRLPFTGQNEYQIYDQILRKRPSSLRNLVPDLPEVIDAIVLKSLRKDRGRRFQSAGEMARVLEVALNEIDPEFGPRELARILTTEVPQNSAIISADSDDDFVTVDSLPSSSSGDLDVGLDEEAIDRLTRAEIPTNPSQRRVAIPKVVLPQSGATRVAGEAELDSQENQRHTRVAGSVEFEVPARSTRVAASAEIEAPARATRVASVDEAEPELAATMALPAVSSGIIAIARAEVPRPIEKRSEQEAKFHRAETAPVALRVDTNEGSVPSIHTSDLVGLRRRRWPYVIVLIGVAVIAAFAVIALDNVDSPAQTQIPKAVRIGYIPDVQLVMAQSLDAAVPDITVVAAVAVDLGIKPDSAIEPSKPTEQTGKKQAVKDQEDETGSTKIAQIDDKKAQKKTEKKTVTTPKNGYIAVVALPWAYVEIDGKRRGQTPMRRLSLRSGRHRIRLISPEGRTWGQRVVIKPGKLSKVRHAF